MIARMWHGWTTPENANSYETLLKEKVFPDIKNRKVTGFRKIRLLRRNLEDEIEFITIMEFDAWDSVQTL